MYSPYTAVNNLSALELSDSSAGIVGTLVLVPAAITGAADVPATVMDNNSASNALRIFFIILLLSNLNS